MSLRFPRGEASLTVQPEITRKVEVTSAGSGDANFIEVAREDNHTGLVLLKDIINASPLKQGALPGNDGLEDIRLN